MTGNDSFSRLRRRRWPYSSSEENNSHTSSTPQYAIIFDESSPDEAQTKVTGELVKMKRISSVPHADGHLTEKSSDGKMYLCICEKLTTHIVCEGVISGNAEEEYLSNYFEESSTIHIPEEPITSLPKIELDCIDSITSAISSWWANNSRAGKPDVSQTDVENVYNILLPTLQEEHMLDDEFTVDQLLISALRLDLDDENKKFEENGARHKDSTSLMSNTLRLIITGDPTTNELSTDSLQMSLKTLPSHIPKVPLISLVLQQKGHPSGCISVLDDPLLRACVKRLFTGRVLLHSDSSGGGSRTLIRSTLSVKVPLKTSVENGDEMMTLQFDVTDIQSRIKPMDYNQRMYVILPSSRIIFQEGKTSNVIEKEDTFKKKEIEPEKATFQSKPDQTITTPHQHLLETLRILLYNSDQHHGPLISRSFLFSGPAGVGKTFGVKKAISVANSWVTDSRIDGDSVHLVSIRGSELLAMSNGSNATAARELERQFEAAAKLCQFRKRNSYSEEDDTAKAVIIFLDECDALVSSHVVAAMLASLLDKMEGVGQQQSNCGNWGQIIVVGATNRVDAIPSFLRRPGRMEKEVVFSPPSADERFSLLEVLLGNHDIPPEKLQSVAEECVGYVAADLSALVRKAAMLGIERRLDEDVLSAENGLSDCAMITANDLIAAMKDTPASCLRDASLSAPPKTTWDDIAGDAGGAKTELRIAIEWPRTRKAAYKALCLSPPRGVLLHGPPGCAKTTLARAAAGSAGVSFLSLAPADVYSSSFVGDAEAVVRRAFDLARSAAPCVLFFDEIDAIIGGEGDGSHGMDRGNSAEARVLSTFLNEMDGVDGSIDDGVLVLAATNRPATLDAALLRPGRFDKVIYVPSPDKAARAAILTMECNKWYKSLSSFTKERFPNQTIDIGTVEEYFNIDSLACDDISRLMTGAEIKHACAETAVNVMRESLLHSGSLDIDPALAQTLLESLKKGLEKALRDTTPLLASSLEEYIRFDQENQG